MQPTRYGLLVFAFTAALAALGCNFPGLRTGVPTPPISTLAPATPLPTIAVTPTPPPTATPWYVPTFEAAPCRFPVPSGYEPTCGYLTVPERRDQPGASHMIRLHVAVFRCQGGAACQPDAVIHLTGGPGSYGLALIPYMFDTGAAAILQARDYVFFDQRGIGFSEPALDCLEGEGADACHERLLNEGVDLDAYNSAASAADIQDLRLALGYAQVNLLGVSYGTRLALTVMRDRPEGIRSVVLDSAYPPQVNLYTAWAANAERAFNQTFAACAADPACNAAYPDLGTVFFQVVDQLNAGPVTVDAPGSSGPVPIEVTGDLFMDTVYVSHYRADVIPNIPKLIYQARDGDYTLLSGRLVIYLDRSSSLGMNYSVQCYEEVPFSTWDDLIAGTLALEHPQVAYFGTRLAYFYELCETWGSLTAPDYENAPVSSPIPTLILAGQFDPITPPEWGDLTAATLPNSYVFRFPQAGHWILRSGPCGWEVVLAFLNNPAQRPEVGCLAGLGPPVFR